MLLAGGTAYLLVVIGTGAWLFIPFLIPATWWIRRSAKREFASLNIAPRLEVPRGPSAANANGVIPYFSKLALLYAVLVDRAGSETYLKQKELPEGHEVITRRNHLELLKSRGIWEKLALWDREANMLPDGAWDWPRINKVAVGVEPIRLLRWILRIDFCQPLIAVQISADFSIAQELVKNPQTILDATDLVDIDTIRSAGQQAQMILFRCLAESISRGYLVPKNANMISWANEVSSSLHGNQNEDFLIGDKLVSEASERQLSWTLSVANIRHEFLTRAESMIDGKQALPETFESIFAEAARNENPTEADESPKPITH